MQSAQYLQIFNQYGDTYRQGEVYFNMAIALYHEADYLSAKIYNEKALDIYIEYHDLVGQAEVNSLLDAIFYTEFGLEIANAFVKYEMGVRKRRKSKV